MTANTIALKSGSYSTSNGQLMKTFVAYAAAVSPLVIGLKRLAEQHRLNRALYLLQRQPAELGDRGNLASLVGPFPDKRLRGLLQLTTTCFTANDLARHLRITPSLNYMARVRPAT